MAKKIFSQLCLSLAVTIATLGCASSNAASGTMGVGIPNFGTYSTGSTYVWSLGSQTHGFPSGCAYITLTKATLGDEYKVMVATLLLAKSTGKAVLFYAHADRDGGCGIDYVQLL